MLSTLLYPDRGRRWLDGETQATLASHAQRIAAAIAVAPEQRVVLSCKHARSYVPGLLGAWLAGATVELLPNVQPGTLDRVDADPEIAYVLHDDPDRQDRARKALYVPALITHEAPLTSRSLPELAVRMTTSGTTERPKFVEKTLAQLVDEIAVLARMLPAARCVLSTVPFSHLYGLLWGVLLPLRTGAMIATHEALLPADVASAVERESVDLLISTPAHLRAMAEAAMPRGLRVISSAARLPAPLHANLIARHAWQVTDVLGATETGGIATRSDPDAGWTPLPGVSVTAPEQQLVVESAWCTGGRVALDDRIELFADGTFEYLGRTSELVKIAGKRADASAIEATVRAVPGITDAAVLVHGAADREQRIALAVTTEVDVSRDVITAAIRHQFDAVFVPKIFRVVARIPRTERGKLDARELRTLLGIADGVIDQVPFERIGPGEYRADVPSDLVFFEGHFDTFRVLCGAAVIDRIVWPIVKFEHPEVGELRAVRRLRFRRPITPAQTVSVRLAQTAGKIQFEILDAATQVVSGQLVVT
ncbi:xanthomonadin biosynthesis 3-hydroxybenozate--AMP ligase XanA2 [soil metagenome]